MGVEITINDSYTRKVDTSIYQKAMSETVEETATRAMEECQFECPVRTGNLRDSHEVEINDMSASITNSAEYWVYVVYGTSRQAPNNYPMRALNTISSQQIISTIFKDKLIENGIDVE